MKVLGHIAEIINKDLDSKYPFGANIRNETDTIFGTPVVREIYGEILMNLYKLLELTNENPTGTEDNDTTQYQIVNSIKKLANDINDTVEVMQLDGTQFSLNIDFSILPNKFVKIVKPAENYNFSNDYTVIGLDENEYWFTSVGGFNSSDLVLLIFETSGVVTAYSLTKSIVDTNVYTPFGSPLAYNSSQVMMYQNDGVMISQELEITDYESIIRTQLSDVSLIVKDIFRINGSFIFTVTKPSDNTYLKVFHVTNSNPPIELIPLGNVSPFSNEETPVILCENSFLYISNGSGSLTNKYTVDKYQIVVGTNTLTFASRVDLDFSYLAVENAIVKNGFLYEFNSGQLDKYNLSSGAKTNVVNLGSVNGQIFMFNGNAYLTTGEIGTKLNI